jgi:hypothetical protein
LFRGGDQATGLWPEAAQISNRCWSRNDRDKNLFHVRTTFFLLGAAEPREPLNSSFCFREMFSEIAFAILLHLAANEGESQNGASAQSRRKIF